MRRTIVAVAALLGAAVSGVVPEPAAAAQGTDDYTVTSPTGLYEAPPLTATTISFTNQDPVRQVLLPFEFFYFGAPFDRFWVARTGYVQFGVTTGSAQPSQQNMSTITQTREYDGVCAPMWGNMYPNGSSARCSWFTTGTSPNRRVVVTWEEYGNYNTTSGWASFQAKFFEGSNRVEFAYKPDSVPPRFTGITYSCGMDAFGTDTRWVVPVTPSQFTTTFPSSDYRFDPRLVEVSGRLVGERYRASASGLSGPTDQALARIAVELRNSSNALLASSAADDAGDFRLSSPVPPGEVRLVALARTPACTVLDPDVSPSAAHSLQLSVFSTLTASADTGTIRITALLDPDAAFRAPANVARAVEQVRLWASTRLPAETIAPVDVHWSATSSAATSFTNPVGATPCTIRIAGPAASNPDSWDDVVIQSVYGRYVLGSIAAFPANGVAADLRFDAVTTAQNAFAQAFGVYLASAVSGVRTFLDATGASSATSVDLEDPRPATPKGPDVTAWVAATLYDLLDAANEPHDRWDGTAADAGADPLRVAASIVGVPTVDGFYDAWSKSGADAAALSRLLVAAGLVPDDAWEANDDGNEAKDLGALPRIVSSLVLNAGNEDWFRIQVPATSTGIVTDMDFARTTYAATVLLEIHDAAGRVVATRLDSSYSPVSVQTGPLAAGTYRVRVRHVSGKIVPSYTLQTAERLTFANRPFPAWTVGRPFAYDLPITGGLPPYTFQVLPAGGAPPGMALVPSQVHAAGTPSEAGTWSFALVVRDSGTPSHEVTSTLNSVVHPELRFDLGEFVALPAGRTFSVSRPFDGGTPPYDFALDEGALPEGVALDPADLRLTGTVEPGASARLRVRGVDVAGSEWTADGRVVACVPFDDAAAESPLAAGDAACGFWFDAVQGSVASVRIGTVKKQPRRTLQVAVTGPSGVVPSAKAKGGKGRGTVTSLVCPVSGRYYVVVASDVGDATALTASVKVRPPAKSKGKVPDFASGSTWDIPVGALAGANLQVRASVPKATGMTLTVQFVFAPDGSMLPLDGIAKTDGGVVTLSTPLAVSGTWIVRLRGQGGDPGTLTWSAAVKQPKQGNYEAGDDE